MVAHRRRQTENFSLLPFMAVLICTMGALIVLLVVLVQQARVSANNEEAIIPLPGENDDLVLIDRQIEDASWRANMLQQSHGEMVNRLTEGRLRLSHVEEHIRRLEDRIHTLGEQVQALDNDASNQLRDPAADRRELDRLMAEIETARAALEEARRAAADRPQSYALIPYEGPSGTKRRPIYIECSEDRIVIHPEQVEFRADDFRPPLGPHNALASALRVIREYLARTGQIDGNSEPYPLLIVRPDGAVSYAAARRAMQSWDAEFGYELLEKEITLEYAPADPQLAAEMQRAVDDARQLQHDLALAAPSRHGRGNMHGGTTGAQESDFNTIVGLDDYPSHGSSEGGNGEQAEGLPSSQSIADNASSQTEENANSGSPLNQETGESSGPGGPAATGALAHSPLAEQRGQNWALQNYTPGATGFTRPIRIALDNQKIVVIPERGTGDSAIILPAEGPLSEVVDDLVAALRSRVERWGPAGANAYWKPILTMDVAPNAEDRFETLSRLLQRSGIELVRREP